jgi:pilus assembly protein CpaB
MTTSPPHSSRRPSPGRRGHLPGWLRLLGVLARLGGWPRRLLALTLLLLAVLLWQQGPVGLEGAGQREPVLAAAHDLGPGAVLRSVDVRLVQFDRALVPAGALQSARSALGRTVAGSVRRGEPITDVRLVGPGLTSGLRQPDSVAVPVRLADGESAALLRAGDRVDLLATPADGAGPLTGEPDRQAVEVSGEATEVPGDAVPVAVGVRVLAVLARSEAATEDGVVVVVAAAEETAHRLAGLAAHARLSIALRPP